MSQELEGVKNAVHFLEQAGLPSRQSEAPIKTGIILGTGLGEALLSNPDLEIKMSLPYKDIPGFLSISHAEFHLMQLHHAVYKGHHVIILQGRFHYYEGYSMQEITFNVRVLGMMGVKILFLSNVAGSMRRDWKKGQLMWIEDHINLQPDSPLRGPNIKEFGPRFVDMSAPYSPSLQKKIFTIAKNKNILLYKGVYAAVVGPQLETRAEYRYLQRIGADVVGMSTVPEVIAANQMGMECGAISVLSDDCDPDNLSPISIPDVMATVKAGDALLSPLLLGLLSG